MLQENVDLLAFVEQRADALDLLDVQSVEQLRGAKLVEDIGELQVAQQRIVGFFAVFLPFFSEVNETIEMFLSRVRSKRQTRSCSSASRTKTIA